uniref:Ig-like domain-containing protein n=1 Tax=Neolamprologus brichardi TaxID=32507 RepID=A0A3Q4GXY0_NEOBR
MPVPRSPYLFPCSSPCVSFGLPSLLCVSCLRTFVVTQSPDVSVMEGKTVSITCCWTGKFERFRVYWLKNQTEIRSDYFNQPNASLKKEEKKCSSLNISNVRTVDSGTYICKVTVEIPSLAEAKGNGTVITMNFPGRHVHFTFLHLCKEQKAT